MGAGALKTTPACISPLLDTLADSLAASTQSPKNPVPSASHLKAWWLPPHTYFATAQGVLAVQLLALQLLLITSSWSCSHCVLLLQEHAANATNAALLFPPHRQTDKHTRPERCWHLLSASPALLHVYVHARESAPPPALVVVLLLLVLLVHCARRAVGATAVQHGMQEAMVVMPVLLLLQVCWAACLCMHVCHVPVAVVGVRRVWPCLWPHTHVSCMVVRLRRCVDRVTAGIRPLLLLLLLLLLPLPLLCQPPPLPLVCIACCALGCCDGCAVGSRVKGLEALEGHLLTCGCVWLSVTRAGQDKSGQEQGRRM